MERIFSVDDIVGTLWNSGGDLSIGVQSGSEVGEANGSGEIEYNPHFGLNRSASEFAFQEFIKHSCREPSRNDTLTYISSDEEAENDEDFCRVLPLRDEAENDEAPAKGAEEDRAKVRELKQEDSVQTTGSTSEPAAPKVDEQLNSETVSKPKEATAESSFEEPEIKAALNPLFSGLHSEMTPTSDPQEINTYYQEKLAEACLRARKAREGVLGLPESDQPGLQQKKGATSGADASSGGLGTATRLPSKPVTSGSSQDQSDDEDGENEQNLEPGNEKRVKRMLSNRESARRSRRRKQAHLNELESQVAQLRVQNSTFAESLHATNQKLKDASKDNLQLKTYVEMLKAKLLAVSTLHRQLTMTRSQGHPHRPQDLPALSHGFSWDSGPHSMQDARSSQSFMMPPPRTTTAPAQMNSQHHQGEQSISETVQQGVKMSRTPSMQRVGSMDHLKKRVRNVGASCSPTSWASTGLDMEGASMIPQFSLTTDY
ncbi:unnamed protein product [Calypogeia fissa]